MRRTLRGIWLGRRRYEPVHALQKALHEARREGRIGDTVLLLEHEPVVTFGRGAHAENLLVPRELLTARGIDLAETGRGGNVTLHAPGQLVCYPIVDLSPDRCDVRRYVRDLAETMRRLALEHDVAAGSIESLVGLWVDPASLDRFPGEQAARSLAKLGAIGVRISRWVTMHGFALNLTTDLELFGLIVPCGISQHGVASVQSLTGRSPDVQKSAERALAILGDVLDADISGLSDHSAGALPPEAVFIGA